MFLVFIEMVRVQGDHTLLLEYTYRLYVEKFNH